MFLLLQKNPLSELILGFCFHYRAIPHVLFPLWPHPGPAPPLHCCSLQPPTLPLSCFSFPPSPMAGQGGTATPSLPTPGHRAGVSCPQLLLLLSIPLHPLHGFSGCLPSYFQACPFPRLLAFYPKAPLLPLSRFCCHLPLGTGCRAVSSNRGEGQTGPIPIQTLWMLLGSNRRPLSNVGASPQEPPRGGPCPVPCLCQVSPSGTGGLWG